MAVAVGDFAAIGFVDGAGGDGEVGGGVHVVPPEHVGAGDGWIAAAGGFPDFFALHEMVGLFPELDFRQLAVVPAVADDAVLLGRQAGEHGGLDRGGDGGEAWGELAQVGLAFEVSKMRRPWADEGVGKADDIDDSDGVGHGPCMIRLGEGGGC